MARSGEERAPARRLFVAIELPNDIRHDLATAAAAVREDAPDSRVRWSAPESWHLTLTFCGSVDAGRVPELEDRLGRAGRRHAPLQLSLRGAGRFGKRVLWTGLAGDRERLAALAATVAAAARRSGILVDDRPYKPHLTLARGAPGADFRGAVAALRDYRGPTWRAEDFVLVESHLGAGPGGTARHDVIGRWPLEGTPA